MSSTTAAAKSTYKTAILSTVAIVVLLGAQTLFFMLQPPQSLEFEKTTAKRTASASLGLRAPASTLQSESDSIATIQLACDGPQETVLSHEMTQVRLKGDYCADRHPFAGTPGADEAAFAEVTSEVINDANGFSATVFPLKNRMFTTDFISLASGLNRIRLLHSYSNGEREAREYLIERKKP